MRVTRDSLDLPDRGVFTFYRGLLFYEDVPPWPRSEAASVVTPNYTHETRTIDEPSTKGRMVNCRIFNNWTMEGGETLQITLGDVSQINTQ